MWQEFQVCYTAENRIASERNFKQRTEITMTTRTETDSFGPLEVPSDKYWGA